MLGAAINDFLTYCRLEKQLSQHTLDAYRGDLRDFGQWIPSDITSDCVTGDHLKGYFAHLVDRDLASASLRRRFACLRSFFRRVSAVSSAPDPFSVWQPQFPRRKRLPRALSRSEISDLLTACRRTARSGASAGDVRVAVRLMISTGIRVGELCSLRPEDISHDGSMVRVRGKGSRDRVAFVTDARLQADLRALARRAGGSPAPGEVLFVNRSGSSIRPPSIRSRLRGWSTEAGLQRRVTPHMLRHTAATLLLETGVDIRFVQKLLGHSSIATTEIYTHVTDEALRSTLLRADVLASVDSQDRR